MLVAGCVAGDVVPVDEGTPTEADDDDDDDAPPLPDLPPADGLEPYSEGLVELGWSAPHPELEGLTTLGELRSVGGGAAALDLTDDGLVDFVLTTPFGPTSLFVNLGEDGWTPAGESGFPEEPAYCVSAADLDGDGIRDFLLCLRDSVRIYRGLGDTLFEDVGTLWQGDYLPVSINLSDWDGDGLVDVHLSTQGVHEMSTPVQAGSEYMFRGLGNFSFEDTSEQFGSPDARAGQPFTATWIDVDHDGDLDLYTIKDRGDRLVPNCLYLNPGPKAPLEHWPEVASEYFLDLRIAGMGAATGDINLDGVPEVVFTDVDARVHLYSVPGGEAFEVSTPWEVVLDSEFQESTWGVELPDLDNDGDLDLVFAAGRREYAHHWMPADNGLRTFNLAEGRFERREDLLLDQERTGNSEAWRDVLAVDLEGDGTLELLFTPHVGPASLQVTTPNSNHWLQIALEGPPGNPSGLGSQVSITAAARGRKRTLTAGQGGMASVVEPVVHFGLGGVEVVDELKVIWPDGSETALAGPMEPDQRLVVRWEE
jgi:hypothetical protein